MAFRGDPIRTLVERRHPDARLNLEEKNKVLEKIEVLEQEKLGVAPGKKAEVDYAP
jgi:hypothetical protein